MAAARIGDRKREPRRTRPCSVAISGAGVLLAALAAFLVSSAPAHGATGHDYLSALSEAPAGTPLEEPRSLTVEHATGKLFVVDPAAGVVDVFSFLGRVRHAVR